MIKRFYLIIFMLITVCVLCAGVDNGPTDITEWHYDFDISRGLNSAYDCNSFTFRATLPSELPQGKYSIWTWHWDESETLNNLEVYSAPDGYIRVPNFKGNLNHSVFEPYIYPYEITMYITGVEDHEVTFKHEHSDTCTSTITTGIIKLHPGDYIEIVKDCTEPEIRTGLNINVYFTLDDCKPENPSDLYLTDPDTTDLFKIETDKDGMLYTPYEQPQMKWNVPNDNGHPLSEIDNAPSEVGVLATTSGIRGYYVIVIDASDDSEPFEQIITIGNYNFEIMYKKIFAYERYIHETEDDDELVTYSLKEELDDGKYTIKVVTFDKAGNIAINSNINPPISETFIVDTTPPSVPTLQFDTATNTFSWDESTDGPGIGISNYIFYLNDDEYVTTETSSTPNNFESGENTAYVAAQDALGNTSIPSNTVSFFIDNIPPSAPLLSGISLNDDYAIRREDNNAVIYYTNENSFTLGWEEVTEADVGQSGVKGYIYTLEKDGIDLLQDPELAVPEIVMPGILEEGEYKFTISTVDNAGNISEDPITVIVYVMNLPGITFGTPPFIIENDICRIRWNEIDIATPDVIIESYKVRIVNTELPGDALKISDFDGITGQLTTEYTASSLIRGIEYEAWVLAEDNANGFSMSAVSFKLPVLDIGNPADDDPVHLTDEEFWWEDEYNMYSTFIVDEGAILHILPGANILVHGQGNIKLIIRGTLRIGEDVEGADATKDAVFKSVKTDELGTLYSAWDGIIVEGEAEIDKCAIMNAERGVTVLPGSLVSVTECTFNLVNVGIHIYGNTMIVDNSVFDGCRWYGIKEDDMGENVPVITNNRFINNGHNYYKDKEFVITIDELNSIPDNSGNEE